MPPLDLFLDTWMRLSFLGLPIIFIDNVPKSDWYDTKIVEIFSDKFINIRPILAPF